MKTTKSKLKQIIKEELESVLESVLAEQDTLYRIILYKDGQRHSAGEKCFSRAQASKIAEDAQQNLPDDLKRAGFSHSIEKCE